MTIPYALAVALLTSLWLLGTSALIAFAVEGLVLRGRLPWRFTLAALVSTTVGLAVVIYAVGR